MSLSGVTERGPVPDPAADDVDTLGDRRAGLPIVLIVAVAVIGLAVRVFLLRTSLGRPDSDEVLSGLMARNVGTDGYPPFLWGQHYGGTVQLAPVIVSMRIFGSSVWAMRLPNLGLAALNCVLVWRIARRFLPERSAQLAGLLLWLGPANAVWFGIREQLFYPPTVTLGLLLGVFAFRIRERDRLIDYAGLGLAAGVAFWTSPNLIYFVVPAAFVVLWDPKLRSRLWRLAQGSVVALVCAVAGAAPWIHDYLEYDGLPLRAGGTFPTTGTYPTRFAHFFTEGLPGVLGFRETFTHDWVGGPLGMLGAAAVTALLLVGAARSLRRAQWDGIGFAAFPVFFAAIPWVMDDPNLRYLFFVVPFVAVLLARSVTSVRVAIVALGLTLAMTGVGLHRIYDVSEVQDTGYRVGNVGDLDEAIAVLDAHGIDRVYGDYWVAYRIDFETDERIIAAPSWGIDRYERYTRTVRESPRSAWVVSEGQQAADLRAALDRLGVTAQHLPAGELVVVIPSRPVHPPELPEGARRPLTASPRS